LFGLSGVVSAQADANSGSATSRWHNKNGEVEIPQSELDKWTVTFHDREVEGGLQQSTLSGATDQPDVYVGQNKNSVPPSQRLTTSGFLPPTYLTLASGRLGSEFGPLSGTGWELTGGVRFNVTRLEASVDLTITIGATDVELWGWSVGPKGDRGICSDVSPGAFPLVIEPCLDLYFGTNTLSVGGSVNLCSPEVGGVSYCIGAIGFSYPVPIPDEITDQLP
jgi:hypothetical protein